MLYNGIGSGINGGIRQTAKQPAAWMALWSSVNPAVLMFGVLGLAAYALYNGAKDAKKPERQPLPNGSIAAKSTVQPLTKPLTPKAEAVEAGVNSGMDTASLAVASPEDDAFRREAVRQHMSELGKRSAAARARKRLEQPS